MEGLSALLAWKIVAVLGWLLLLLVLERIFPLARVVGAVSPHRADGADPHPFNQFAAERLHRWRICNDPASIGCASLSPADPPVMRTNLKDAVPCCAVAVVGGVPTAVVCTTGIDLDAVPFAVDARRALGLEACILAMPARDAIQVQRDLAALAAPPISIVPVD